MKYLDGAEEDGTMRNRAKLKEMLEDERGLGTLALINHFLNLNLTWLAFSASCSLTRS